MSGISRSSSFWIASFSTSFFFFSRAICSWSTTGRTASVLVLQAQLGQLGAQTRLGIVKGLFVVVHGSA